MELLGKHRWFREYMPKKACLPSAGHIRFEVVDKQSNKTSEMGTLNPGYWRVCGVWCRVESAGAIGTRWSMVKVTRFVDESYRRCSTCNRFMPELCLDVALEVPQILPGAMELHTKRLPTRYPRERGLIEVRTYHTGEVDSPRNVEFEQRLGIFQRRFADCCHGPAFSSRFVKAA